MESNRTKSDPFCSCICVTGHSTVTAHAAIKSTLLVKKKNTIVVVVVALAVNEDGIIFSGHRPITVHLNNTIKALNIHRK